jgi:hypothetical protein
METTKREIERLCSITVVEENSDSAWAAGTFIQPKKPVMCVFLQMFVN